MSIVNVNIKNTSGIEDGSNAHPYSNIQKAVDAANAGDMVKVAVGTYNDRVSINKSIFLEGAGEDKTIISFDPSRFNPIIYISGNDVTVSRFTITSPNRQGQGILIRDAYNITISKNKVTGLQRGIDVQRSASYVKISSNTVTNNGYGILFSQTSGGGGYGSYNNNTIENNTVINNSSSNIFLCDTTNSIVKNNKVKGGHGRIAGITLAQCCSYNVIESNEIESTFGTGIGLLVINKMAPTYNTITRNTIKLSLHGISVGSGLPKSSNNRIYHNNIINNHVQAGDDGENNLWDNGAMEGNFWSDYTGDDTNGNGIGDTKVPHFGLDSYPLMKPFEIDTIPPDTPILKSLPLTTNEAKIVVGGSAEPKSDVEVFVNEALKGSARADDAGRFNIEVEFEEGTNEITAKATDSSGNISKSSAPIFVSYQIHPLWDVPIIDVMGVGKVYADKLEAQGVNTIADMVSVDVSTLSENTGISLYKLYMWKRRAVLAMDVKIDQDLFTDIQKIELGDIITLSDEELSSKAHQPIEIIPDLKKDISALFISLDNDIVKSMTIESLAA